MRLKFLTWRGRLPELRDDPLCAAPADERAVAERPPAWQRAGYARDLDALVVTVDTTPAPAPAPASASGRQGVDVWRTRAAADFPSHLRRVLLAALAFRY